MPLGGSGSRKNANNSPISRKAEVSSRPIPIATRLAVPNKLHKTGISKPIGFSNNKAGPSLRNTRSAISVISR